jgi:hypothetical protein
MKNVVKRAYYLAGGKPVEVKEENGRRQLIVPRPIVDPMATVIVVEIEGRAGGTIALHSGNSVALGRRDSAFSARLAI